jgi:signal transduction histidine kinase
MDEGSAMSIATNIQPAVRRKRPRIVRREHGSEGFASSELLRESGELAAQKMCALGEMTGGIAHDFRNILTIVASGLRVAERNAGDPVKLKSALAAIQEGVGRGERMASRLLSFASQQDLIARPEDVNQLLRKLEAFLKYGAGSGFRIDLSLAANLPDCLVDPPRFNAAILNLVVNARDAMPGGGLIRISSAAVRGMSLGEPCDYVRVRVRDDGRGMAPEVLERVFDPYFTTKGDRGTGLGIPQVHALMQQVGGFVRVDSAVGEGTSFDLFFPAHDDRPKAAGDAWRELDQWANEGGAIAAGSGPALVSGQ